MYAEKAFALAKRAHKGQKDKAGEDYINHLITVASYMDTDEEKAIAYLHDLIEDTSFTLEQLKKEGYSNEILIAIDTMTKKENVTYAEYIEQISKNSLARKVKTADLLHNLDLRRLKNPTKEDYERCEKYKRSILFLVTHQS